MLALTPDASTREYFRIPWKNSRAVAAVYPEPFDPEIHPFLDVSRLFADAGLPVPKILDVDSLNGIIVQEDFGDQQLRRDVVELGAELHLLVVLQLLAAQALEVVLEKKL